MSYFEPKWNPSSSCAAWVQRDACPLGEMLPCPQGELLGELVGELHMGFLLLLLLLLLLGEQLLLGELL